MSLSLGGAMGAAIGGTIGAISARLIVAVVESRLRALDKSQSAAEREVFERKVALMWRIIVTVEIATFAAIGYWLGGMLGG